MSNTESLSTTSGEGECELSEHVSKQLEIEYAKHFNRKIPTNMRRVAAILSSVDTHPNQFVTTVFIYLKIVGCSVEHKHHVVRKLLKISKDKNNNNEYFLKTTCREIGENGIEKGNVKDKYELTRFGFMMLMCTRKGDIGQALREYVIWINIFFWKVMNTTETRKRNRTEFERATNLLHPTFYRIEIGRVKNETYISQHDSTRDRIAYEIGGMTEAQVHGGRVDVLSADTVVEIKPAEKWKAAIGQVLAYSIRDGKPHLKTRIHLLGTPSSECIRTCSEYDIQCTFEHVIDGNEN